MCLILITILSYYLFSNRKENFSFGTPVTPADGSCAGNCGGYGGYSDSINGCWCDSICESAGDCCCDVFEHCGINKVCESESSANTGSSVNTGSLAITPEDGSCVGKCGEINYSNTGPNGYCACDEECKYWGDCCCDVFEHCGINKTCSINTTGGGVYTAGATAGGGVYTAGGGVYTAGGGVYTPGGVGSTAGGTTGVGAYPTGVGATAYPTGVGATAYPPGGVGSTAGGQTGVSATAGATAGGVGSTAGVTAGGVGSTVGQTGVSATGDASFLPTPEPCKLFLDDIKSREHKAKCNSFCKSNPNECAPTLQNILPLFGRLHIDRFN